MSVALERRIPLARTPFRRKAPVNTARVARLPVKSKKREAAAKEYRLLRERLVEHPSGVCRVCGSKPSVDLHHRREMGMGGALSNPQNVVPVCRSCHNRVHDEQAWSRSQGLLVFEGDAGWADLGARVWRQQ